MRTEEQQDLAAAVHALLTKQADSASVRAAIESEAGYDTSLWSKLCNQIGVAGLEVADTAPVLEELGYSLAPTPLLASLVASEALRGTVPHSQSEREVPPASDLIARIEAGEIAAFVTLPHSHGEREVPPGPVLYGADATILLAVTDAGLVLLDGVDAQSAQALDPTLRFATVTGSPARVLDPDGVAAADRARTALLVGISALAVGCAQRGLDMTVAYAKERVQFGRPIGSFQALKHRMAEMLVLLEMSRSASWAAALSLASGAEDADQLVHAATSYAGEALSRIAAETVQLHGGIAITWEHDAHLVFKRAQALGQLFGSAGEHRKLVAL